jgi:hypothetical protein
MLQRRHAGSTKSVRGGAEAVMERLQPQMPAKILARDPRALRISNKIARRNRRLERSPCSRQAIIDS